ncbi:hypothetical protein [Methanosphaera sp.]|uniref:hypothetical protein n=1 Tax=Methanosphaera sp. TaxID=2666342 RepID=UPI0025E9E691|nr:hypothetical protein [Methanosphaera sp.]
MFKNFDDFEPKYFLDFSKELYDSAQLFTSNSAVNRVIYGRIYYGTFLYVREWLKKYWGYNSTSKDHTQMINFIRSRGPFGFILNTQIADDLELLKKLRHQADYFITLPCEGSKEYSKWTFESITDAFNIAQSIIGYVDEIEVS